MRAELLRHRLASFAFVLCILIAGAPILGGQPEMANAPGRASDPAPAIETGAAAPRPALVFFSQHKLTERAWAALFTAMQSNLPEAAAEVPALGAHAELIRGDALPHETTVPQSITVYLHGDCVFPPMPQPLPMGEPLGWVIRAGAQIQPVIHVECTPIGQEISEGAEWMDRDERTAAMSEALARVILHEWAHVATQTSAHGPEGITKARFGVGDLLPGSQVARFRASGLR